MIMACSMNVVSSSPCFFEAVSYSLQMFHISHIYVADVAYISKGTTSLVYESNISRTRHVCMATNRSVNNICCQTFPFLMDLSVMVSLLDTVVSSKHLHVTSILEVVILRHLTNNWFEIKRMCTTVFTRLSFLPFLQIGIGTPGYEANTHIYIDRETEPIRHIQSKASPASDKHKADTYSTCQCQLW